MQDTIGMIMLSGVTERRKCNLITCYSQYAFRKAVDINSAFYINYAFILFTPKYIDIYFYARVHVCARAYKFFRYLHA